MTSKEKKERKKKKKSQIKELDSILKQMKSKIENQVAKLSIKIPSSSTDLLFGGIEPGVMPPISA